MNTYILILTMMYRTGYAGIGGVTTIEVKDLEICNRVGSSWVADIKSERKRVGDYEVLYTCVKN